MSGWGPSARQSLQAGFLLAAFVAGVAVGLLWGRISGSQVITADYEIRRGHEGLTNQLLECEISGYRLGRELRPFKRELQELVQRQKSAGRAAQISVYFRDLDNGPWVGVDEDQTYTPASLLKVPVIMACMKQAEGDPALLRREVRFEGYADDRLLARYQAPDPLVVGRRYRLEDLLVRTASASDNYAAALVGQIIDRQLLRRLLYDLGLPAELADNPKMSVALSPRIYGQLFRVLYNATYLDHDTSERTLGFFVHSTFHDGLEAGVPPGTVVAHKFGIYAFDEAGRDPAELHDCGIVYAPDRPYFLCVMTSGRDHAALAGAIAEISRFVYGEIERQVAP